MLLPMVMALAVQAPSPAEDPAVYHGNEGELRVEAPRVEAPDVRVDGRLDEAAWQRAATLTGFTRYEPTEGVPASEETGIRVFYGADALYFGVTAYHSDPSTIRGSLTERDQGVTEDDWVRISLDTFNDDTQAYVFYVNPRGIQADGLWVEGAEQRFGPPIDFNPDFIWESAGRLTEDGWVAELRIPYGSLRFRESAEQTWGLNVVRSVRLTEFKSSWAPLTADAANPLELSGRLVGLRGLESRRLVELNPVATGKRTGQLDERGEFVREAFEPAFGLNARYGITRNLVLDATFNPDFSQVEADAGQIAVNERFALFFPEKRPFFLEGTEVFNTPQRLVYTRAIVDPVGGAKLTGKLGPFSLGYLGAVDESPVTFSEADDVAAFNLFRLRRDVGTGSTIGALYTDRTLVDGSAHNRVAALDTRLLLAGRYTLTAQLAGAWSRELDRVNPVGVRDLFGPLFSAEIARSGRIFSWNASLEDVHPDFRARSGFVRRTGDAQVEGEVQYTFLSEPGAWLEDWSPQLEFQAFYDHHDFWSGRRFQEARIQAAVDVSLRGPNGFNLAFIDSYFAFDPADYDRIPATADGSRAIPAALEHLLGLRLYGRTRPLPWLSIRGMGRYGEVPIYAEATRGKELMVSPTASMRFPVGVMADLSLTYSRIERVDGGRFSVARIPRAKLQYQLNKDFFLRGIVQYHLQQRDALRSSDGAPLILPDGPTEALESGEVQYDLLASYAPSPGTVIYAGWSRLRQGPQTYRFGELTPTAEGLFFKVSYLFRL